MNLRDALVSLVAGILAFGTGTVVVTEALDPYVWPALLVGLPVGVVLALSTVVVTYIGLGYRREQRTTGAVSVRTRRRLRATRAAVATGVVAGGATVGGLATAAFGLALALVVGLAVGLMAALFAAALVWVGGRRGDEGADETSG